MPWLPPHNRRPAPAGPGPGIAPAAEMEKSIMHQKETSQNDVFARMDAVENERKPYCERLSELENERKSIIEELNKDR